MAETTPSVFSGPAKALIIFAAFVVAVAGMRAASGILVPLMLAMFVASICAPAFFALQRLRLPSVLALMALLLLLVLIAMLTVIVIEISVSDLRDKLPSYQAIVQRQFEDLVAWFKDLGTGIDEQEIRALLDWRSAFAFASASLAKATGLVSQTFFVLMLTAFVLLETQYLPCKLRELPEFAPSFWHRFAQILSDLRRYMTMKTLTSLLTGALVLVWVVALGIDFAPLLGFLAFVLNYIPVIGSVFAGVPGVVLALVQHGPWTALLCACGYIVINAGVSNVLEPRFMGRGLGLSPLVVIFSLVFWGWVFGPVGMLLSLPLTMIAKIVMEGFPESRWVAALLGGARREQRQPPPPHALLTGCDRRGEPGADDGVIGARLGRCADWVRSLIERNPWGSTNRLRPIVLADRLRDLCTWERITQAYRSIMQACRPIVLWFCHTFLNFRSAVTELTHFNRAGEAQMVDVGAKDETERSARATGRIRMQSETLRLIKTGGHSKGDVLGIARVAAIMGAKRTADLVPLCHPLALTRVDCRFEISAETAVICEVSVATRGRTGVEMEALCAVQIALLTLYDMCKAVDRGMIIDDIRLLEKQGGRSGHWRASDEASSGTPA